jgi:hypothetical protein
MQEHGLNMTSWWTRGGYKVELVEGRIVADFSGYQNYLKLLDEVGYKGPHVVFLGSSEPKIENVISKLLDRPIIEKAIAKESAAQFENADLTEPFETYLCETLKQFQKQMKEVGHGDLPVCLLDEPDHEPRPQRIDYYNKIVSMVEHRVPDLKLYGVFYHEGDEDRLSHGHAVWCSNRPAAKLAKAAKNAGKELWTYTGGFKYYAPAETARFKFGVIPWVFQASGSFFWANFWAKGDPLDPSSLKELSTVSFATPSGPLATAAFKGIREAVDDRRYIATLEKLIDRAKSSSEPQIRDEARNDQIFLESIRQPLFQQLQVRAGNPAFGSVAPFTIMSVDGKEFKIDTETSPWEFSNFLREDLIKRIVSLQRLMEKD